MTTSLPQRKRVVCFGEPIMRMSAPGHELLLQSRRLDVEFGGAEMNVAVALARLGSEAAAVSVLPDNPIGYAFRDELRKYGVDVSDLQFGPGRMALYFMTQGALVRPAEIFYDRAGSALAISDGAGIDWDHALDGASWLHLSGITPALGAGPAGAILKAATKAKALGVKISFDGNHRSKLWETAPPDTLANMHRLFGMADLLFADHRDIGLVLQRDFTGATDRLQAASEAAFAAFPALQQIACTRRVQHSVEHHDLSACLVTRAGTLTARKYSMLHVIDRIGTGDAFSAGFLHAAMDCREDQAALDFALATAVIKHSMPGDFCLASAEDVECVIAEHGFSVRR